MHEVVEKKRDTRRVGRRVYKSRRWEPSELHRKEVLQHLSEEEGGERYTDHYDYRNDVVADGVLMRCRRDAERYSDHKFEEGCDQGDREGYAHMILNNVNDGCTVLEARSEVEAEHR